MLLEASPLLLEYAELKKIADVVAHENKIWDEYELDNILIKLGAKIIEMEPYMLETTTVPFITIDGEGDFEICVCNKKNIELKRVMLAQALGHYFIHSQCGQLPCKIDKMSQGGAAREGFIFSMSLLLPDESFIKLLQSNLTVKQISKVFRIPEAIISIKQDVLKKYNIL